MFAKAGLKLKLAIMFGFSAAVLFAVGVLSVLSLNKVARYYDHVAKINLPNSVAIQKMESEARQMLFALTQFNLADVNSEELNHLKKELEDAKNAYLEMDTLYTSYDFVSGEESLYMKLDESWNELSKNADASLVLALNVSKSQEERARFASHFRGPLKQSREKFFNSVTKLLQFQKEESLKWVKNAEETSIREKMISSTVVALGFLISLTIGFLFSRSLSLTLISVSEKLIMEASHVDQTATGIAKSSENLSVSTEQLASSVQETSASVEQLTAMVTKNAGNSESSRKKAKLSYEAAINGKKAVEDLLNAIREMNESNNHVMKAMDDSNKTISNITHVISEIGSKTSIINDIVFQTKLLSFNASVEAARAGEHGKGFSVVAEEVGNLADVTGKASFEISKMLENSKREVQQTVDDTKRKVDHLIKIGKERVEEGRHKAEQFENSLNLILVEVEQVAEMVTEISEASQEQASGIKEITKAMSQIDSISHENSQSTQQTADASSDLASQFQSLNSVVSELQHLIYGKKQADFRSKS